MSAAGAGADAKTVSAWKQTPASADFNTPRVIISLS
jgi:hypothetical protein